MDKNIPYPQKKEFGCSFYCIANLFNLKVEEVDKQLSFIEKLPRRAMNEFYENDILRKYYSDLFFVTLYRALKNGDDTLQDTFIFGCKHNNPTDTILEKSYFRAYLFSKDISDQGKDQHRILILINDVNNQCFVVDPCKETAQEIDCRELCNAYEIRAVSLLLDQTKGDIEKRFAYNEVAHLF